ncbi:MAG: RNA polymerase sigma factor [Planctomycetota bacterium]
MSDFDYSLLSDEELAQKCRQNIDEAERALLDRYMQAVYWLPQRNFGAAEEDLSDFLIFAIEKIRKRHIFAKFDPESGTLFSTWFSVVTRNLYLDYLREHKYDPAFYELNSEDLAAELAAEEGVDEQQRNAELLLEKMELKCRTLFKMLLVNCFFLEADEIRWIAEQSGRSIMGVVYLLSEAEEEVREQDVERENKRAKLAAVYWWKCFYERKYLSFANKMNLPEEERDKNVEKMFNMLQKKKEQHLRILEELKKSSAISTTPYKRIADILNMKEGTLGSHITRCRHKSVAGSGEK